MAKPIIKEKRYHKFEDLALGDTFIFVNENKDVKLLCIKTEPIHENDGENVAWNATNLSTGENVCLSDKDHIYPVQIEIEVTY
jgi:hypothetical protein